MKGLLALRNIPFREIHDIEELPYSLKLVKEPVSEDIHEVVVLTEYAVIVFQHN